jgi:hypothetical protein
MAIRLIRMTTFTARFLSEMGVDHYHSRRGLSRSGLTEIAANAMG